MTLRIFRGPASGTEVPKTLRPETTQALSFWIARIAHRARRLRIVHGLKRIRRPFSLWPIIVGLVRPFRGLAVSTRRGLQVTDRLKRPLPSWSILLILLLGLSSGFYLSTALTQGIGSATKNPDFSIGASPASNSIPQGSLATFTLSLNSLNSFAGSVDLNATMSPMIANVTEGLNLDSVSLLTGSGTSTLTVSAGGKSPVGTYSITVVGASSKLAHSVSVYLQVTLPPPPDFQITASPSPLLIGAGSSGSFTITLTSIGGFSGTVNLSARITPNSFNSPSLTFNPNSVALLSGGTANAVLTASTTSSTPRQNYAIVVQGISGSISNTVSVTLTVQ